MKPIYKIINQTQESTCGMCVLAMIVKESEQYVLDWFKYIDPPIGDEDTFIFLAHHGKYLATCGMLKNKKTNKGIDISKIDIISVEWPMTSEAYMVVDSETREDWSHAVFWTGKEVFDPLYKTPQPLSNYKVRYIYPIMHTAKIIREEPMTKYEQYEAEKKKLPPITPKEYEKAIREIAKRLKI